MTPKNQQISANAAPVFLVYKICLAIFFITRLTIFIVNFSAINTSLLQATSVFVIGFFYDVCISGFITILFLLQTVFTTDIIYKKPYCWYAIGFYVLLLFVFFFTHLLPSEYSGDLYTVIKYYLLARFVVYLILFKTGFNARQQWRRMILFAAFFLLCFALIFNGVSEYFFWDEFGARYNFIAVDYLIYTNEVIGNIAESYPIVLIISGVALLAILMVWLGRKSIMRFVTNKDRFTKRSLRLLPLFLVPLLAFFFMNANWMNFSDNTEANELSGNGIFTFEKAFFSNELDFYKYYQTLSDEQAFSSVNTNIKDSLSKLIYPNTNSIERAITATEPEHKMNVVLISVESLSGEFMQAFGSTKNITPFLDSLANKSLFFTNFYASGTRTVRGLEALSMSIPPIPGESIIKRPDNKNMFTIGSLLKSKGYTAQFMYGGYAYFDNMKDFFGGNGYEVIDRAALLPEQIHYANIWGVADEDLFTLAINTLDKDYQKGKPFFTHIMTVSNHRPYTYPEGRIDILPTTKSRDGAVKYTDYAIGKFMKEAATKPWYQNTIFVILADHCASSAGNTDLPLKGYHIPLLIYSPSFTPKKIDNLTAQIDVAPTILGLLHINYTSKFFGQNALLPKAKQRAFISTYQGLGYVENNELVVQTPVKQVKSYSVNTTSFIEKQKPNNDSLVKKAIAYYQAAVWFYKHKK